jgi:uncharacterized protein YkwD
VPRRRSSVAAAFAGLASLAVATGAAAAPMTVQVVNERGVEQVSRVTDSAGSRWTNGHGLVTLDVAPGEQVAATRGDAAPEGAAGVAYSVPNPVPAGPAGITLPALPDARDPAHDAAEAWLLAAVNGARAGLGLAPLQQSGPLNRAADVYARHLFANDVFSHTALSTPPVRALDQGWPVPGGSGIGEVLALAPSKESALGAWKGSSGHWTLLMSPVANVTGVAQAGNRWVMSPSTCAPTDAPERCEIGQSGVRPPASAPSGTPAGKGAGGGEKKARMRVRLRREGRRLVVDVRVLEGRGALKVSVRQGRRRADMRAHRRRNLLRATTVLPRGGSWRVVVRFEGASGWADRRLSRRSPKKR